MNLGNRSYVAKYAYFELQFKMKFSLFEIKNKKEQSIIKYIIYLHIAILTI